MRLSAVVRLLLVVGAASLAVAAEPVVAQGYPDLSSLTPDLTPPAMQSAAPAAGRRVRATLPGDPGTETYYSLYLPEDWRPGGRYPVIVEYPGNGNYRSKHGDISTGRVEDCSLGFGLSGGKGCIWVCVPCVDPSTRSNALVWWGDVAATVAYCKGVVKQVCADYGGDPSAVVLCGFSRGALACNFIGLQDDEVAGLWRAFFVASHYDGAPIDDGAREWPYPGSDRASALARLQRLGRRPVFVSHEVYDIAPGTYSIIDTINYLAGTGRALDNFTFQVVPVRNHTDKWVLYDLPARRRARQWLHDVLRAAPGG
ncbi:MAG: hypothetical protein EXS43_10175 [Opitutus sp.]|nr:hypothetical protein [Opitutus sp.]